MLGDITAAFTRPLSKLAMIFYVMVVMVIIYATFGLEYFAKDFMYDPDYETDDEKLGCESVAGCVWLIFYKGVPPGELVDVMDNLDKTDSTYMARFIFDLSFFIIVGKVIFDITTGLILDTFAELREEASTRENVLKNECFICGLSRNEYADLTCISKSLKSFEQHQEEVHNKWDYFFFICYLKAKDPTEYNGVEKYVSEKLDEGDNTWIPLKNSYDIQEATASKIIEEEDAGDEDKAKEKQDDLLQTVAYLKAKQEDLIESVALLTERIGEMTGK